MQFESAEVQLTQSQMATQQEQGRLRLATLPILCVYKKAIVLSKAFSQRYMSLLVEVYSRLYFDSEIHDDLDIDDLPKVAVTSKKEEELIVTKMLCTAEGCRESSVCFCRDCCRRMCQKHMNVGTFALNSIIFISNYRISFL